jgi:crotonobetainyl-CoA:carnitine CoA-transferase CaiB-like acyl-CoA transferase
VRSTPRSRSLPEVTLTTDRRDAALAGLRVLDCSSGTAGPLAAMLFADFGADVIKVEPPGEDRGRLEPGFAVWNRGKRSAVIDLESVVGQARMRRLIDDADVCVVDSILGDLDAALAPERCLARNPRLVFLHVPAYLPEACWARGKGSHDLLHAITGLALNQASFSVHPVDVLAPYLVTIQGMWAAACAGAALYERRRSGLGQVVTVSGMHAAVVAGCSWFTFDSKSPRRKRPQVGGPAGNMPYYRLYECGDGEWIYLGALSDDFARRAFAILGVEHLLDDPRLGSRGRLALLDDDNAEWAIELIGNAFARRPAAEWLAEFERARIAASPVLRRDDWLDTPQLAAIGMRVEVEDPDRGSVVMPGVPVTLSCTNGHVGGPAPPRPRSDAPTTWLPYTDTTREPAPVRQAGRHVGGPLSGIHVLDLGSVLAGPFAGTLMAELGADVVKVEPLAGDSYRGAGFAPYNKGQRGVALDLRNADGREAFLSLVRRADVVVDNYRPGVLERLRISHAELRQVNPAISSASINGFGEVGPLAEVAGYDPVLQAMSGMARAQGGGDSPVLTSVPSFDVAAATMTVFGSIVALLVRGEHGGQRVSTSLAAVASIVQAEDLVRFAGRPVPREGGRDFAGPSPVERIYAVCDGWVRISAGGSANEVAAAVGADLDAAGPVESLAAAFAMLTRADAVTRLNDAGIAAVPVRHVREVAADPAHVAAGLFRRYPERDLDSWITTGEHATFSRTSPAATSAAPRLGEHTSLVLEAAGVRPAVIRGLLSDGVALQAAPIDGPAVME